MGWGGGGGGGIVSAIDYHIVISIPVIPVGGTVQLVLLFCCFVVFSSCFLPARLSIDLLSN